MQYYKNSQIIKLYNVSDKSVRNWIKSAQEGNIDLELQVTQKGTYIANTIDNERSLTLLAQHGRKYRNSKSHRNLTPTPEFYKFFNLSQIVDIANRIDVDREIPMQYAYFGDGGTYWNDYLHRLQQAGPGNLITNTIEALNSNMTYLSKLIASHPSVNIANVCTGNSNTLLETIDFVQSKSRLDKISLIDLSPVMLKFSEQQIKHSSPQTTITQHIKDVAYETFGEVLASCNPGATNLVFMVGGPIVNFKDPDQALNTIHNSLGKDDYFIITLKLDTERTRRFFDFHVKSSPSLLDFQQQFILRLLNIDDTYYDVEQSFDSAKKLRSIRIRLKLNLSISFKVGNFNRVVDIDKGDSILTMRSHHHSEIDIIQRLKRTGFNPLQVSKSQDEELILIICKVSSAS